MQVSGICEWRQHAPRKLTSRQQHDECVGMCRNVKTLQEWVTDCLNTARKDLRSALEWLNRLDTRLEACRLTVRKSLQ